MFLYGHSQIFSTSLTPVFNGEQESLEMYIDKGETLHFDIKQSQGFNLDIEQQLFQDLYIEEEEDVGFTVQKFPGVTL